MIERIVMLGFWALFVGLFCFILFKLFLLVLKCGSGVKNEVLIHFIDGTAMKMYNVVFDSENFLIIGFVKYTKTTVVLDNVKYYEVLE